MANRTSLVQVSDGDTLSEGYFNDIAFHYNGATDGDASDHTQTDSWGLKRTLTISSMSANDVITGVILKDISLKISDGGEVASLGIEVSDGTTVWSPTKRSLETVGDSFPEHWAAVSAGAPNTFLFTNNTSVKVFEYLYIPTPSVYFTGATSWTLKVYIISSAGAATATLTKGFGMNLVVARGGANTVGSAAEA